MTASISARVGRTVLAGVDLAVFEIGVLMSSEFSEYSMGRGLVETD